jgi:hypothetical protein
MISPLSAPAAGRPTANKKSPGRAALGMRSIMPELHNHTRPRLHAAPFFLRGHRQVGRLLMRHQFDGQRLGRQFAHLEFAHQSLEHRVHLLVHIREPILVCHKRVKLSTPEDAGLTANRPGAARGSRQDGRRLQNHTFSF